MAIRIDVDEKDAAFLDIVIKRLSKDNDDADRVNAAKWAASSLSIGRQADILDVDLSSYISPEARGISIFGNAGNINMPAFNAITADIDAQIDNSDERDGGHRSHQRTSVSAQRRQRTGRRNQAIYSCLQIPGTLSGGGTLCVKIIPLRAVPLATTSAFPYIMTFQTLGESE